MVKHMPKDSAVADGTGGAKGFAFTEKQLEAIRLMGSDAMHVMLFGGGRSGKTFAVLRQIVLRAMKAAGSRHLVVRYRFAHVKASVILDTFPRVMALCFPGVVWELSRTDWYARMSNGSEVWFGGLDDSARMEKVLGLEFATIFVNEGSQFGWSAIQLLMTRLAQKVDQVLKLKGGGEKRGPLKLRMMYDCNPPNKAHWTYLLFRQGVMPETKMPVSNAERYASLQMNPVDNRANLNAEYFEVFESMSGRMRRRFELGEFAEATANALFDDAVIDRWRVVSGELPEMVRIVVSVDPSGAGDSDNADNDAIGIVVCGMGVDGNAYVLEDLTVKAGPGTWGRIAVQALVRWDGDCIVAEANFGGAMVEQTIRVAASTEGRRVTYRPVTASRGKVQRAEPFAALYETGKIRHAGIFAKLEDELCAFSTSGYTGSGSPNRADAAIWGFAALYPSLVSSPKVKAKVRGKAVAMLHAWMG